MEIHHDIDALVSLATDHKDNWGDSCHHALAAEVVRLRAELAAAKTPPSEECENKDDGKEHYNMAHRVEVNGKIQHLCTKCCDRAKWGGAYVRNA